MTDMTCLCSQPANVTEGMLNPVEVDPKKRYIRYPHLLGRGACKRVYKAFDQQEGQEVAWNQVDLSAMDMEPTNRERLNQEIQVLKTLKHKAIITFYEYWYDDNHQTINFITELFTSGTIRQYRKKHKHVSEQVLKRWAWQILEGLVYLHGHDPAIVHRDLKCDNIFINGVSGQTKIGDLGLATCQKGLSVVGTPEFMAPEIYDEKYDEKVDIYSFGMCLLELTTMEYPYTECRTIPQIFKKVTMGVPPMAMSKVQQQDLREFIQLCIQTDPEKRPPARELLKHSFFDSLRSDGSVGYHPIHTIPSCGALATICHSAQSDNRRKGISVCLADTLRIRGQESIDEESDEEVLVPVNLLFRNQEGDEDKQQGPALHGVQEQGEGLSPVGSLKHQPSNIGSYMRVMRRLTAESSGGDQECSGRIQQIIVRRRLAESIPGQEPPPQRAFTI